MATIPTRVRIVVVVSALTFAAGLLTLALMAQPTQAQAQTQSFNERFPVDSGEERREGCDESSFCWR